MTTVFKATAAPAEMSPPAAPPADGQAVASPGALGQLDSIGCGAGPCAATGIALAGLSALSLRPTGLWPVVQTDPVGQAVQSLLRLDDVEHRIQQPHGTWKDHELLRHLKERMQAVKEQIRVLSAFVLQTGWLIGQLETLGSRLTGPAPAPGPAPRQPGLTQGFAAPGGCA